MKIEREYLIAQQVGLVDHSRAGWSPRNIALLIVAAICYAGAMIFGGLK